MQDSAVQHCPGLRSIAQHWKLLYSMYCGGTEGQPCFSQCTEDVGVISAFEPWMFLCFQPEDPGCSSCARELLHYISHCVPLECAHRGFKFVGRSRVNASNFSFEGQCSGGSVTFYDNILLLGELSQTQTPCSYMHVLVAMP